MATSSADYLATEVLTAPPQKLQVMLLEAAVRRVQRAREALQNGQDEVAGEAIIRAQQIVTELLCALNPQADGGLVRKMAGVYLFIFRTLADAMLERSDAKLAEALRVLSEEHQTWQQLCSRLDENPAPNGAAGTTFEA